MNVDKIQVEVPRLEPIECKLIGISNMLRRVGHYFVSQTDQDWVSSAHRNLSAGI